MKKFLYATTALASVGMIAGAASDAAAAEKIKLGLSGYHQQWGVYSSQDIDTPGTNGAGAGNKIKTVAVDQKHNTEVCVIGETTLDNGLTIGVNVQVEANTSSDQIDESYLYVQHASYGQLILGDENNAGYLLHVTAPDGGINVDSGDMVNNDFWVKTTSASYFDSPLATTNLRQTDNDSGKFTYISPRFFGLQAGASFTPQHESGGDDNRSDYFNNTGVTSTTTTDSAGDTTTTTSGSTRNNFKNGVSGGVNYKEKFGDFGVQGSLGAMRASAAQTGGSTDLFVWNAGAQFSFAGFSLGGGYLNNPNKDARVGNRSLRGHSWTVGAAYEWGPYKVGLGYMYGETAGDIRNGADVRLDQANISGTYNLGPGINLVAGFFAYDLDGENVSGNQPGSQETNNDGWGFASGLKLGF